MSTIVKNLNTFKSHVTVNYNFTWEIILPYIKKAERKHIKPVIGDTLYKAYSITAPTDPKPAAVFSLLEEASCNLALLSYTKVGIVSISDSGFTISQNQNATPAEWWQIRDLRRELLNTGMQAIDEALKIMENNEADFDDWSGSEGYTTFREFFVRKTQDFQKHFNIENSRLTFLKLRPHLLKTEDKYFSGLLGTETIEKIKTGASDEAKEALRLCRAAQVSLCVAEVANEGAFLFTPSGLFITTDEIQGEKKTALSESEMYKLHRAKSEDGNAYLKKLVAHLKAFPGTFSEYVEKEANQQTNPVYNAKSIVSF